MVEGHCRWRRSWNVYGLGYSAPGPEHGCSGSAAIFRSSLLTGFPTWERSVLELWGRTRGWEATAFSPTNRSFFPPGTADAILGA